MSYTNGLDKPTDYFRIKTYSGDGSDDRNITWDESSNMQPDMLWSKIRSGADNYSIYDVVRGDTKELRPHQTSVELIRTNNIQALQTNGFQVGDDSQVNGSGSTYVSWGWLADNTSGSSNTDGSITSTVSANTTSGFSIVSWTGTGSSATVGTGLSSTPKLIIVKNRTDTVNWMVYHHSVITAGATNKSFMTLNTTDALGTNSTATTFTSVSDTTFGVGTDNIINGSSDNMIAYVFAEKKGFSKFGSYTGNGSADGTFVYTGFKPAWVMIKRTNTSGDAWVLFDNKRPGYNLIDNFLEADTSGAEAVNNPNQRIDTISNGFKCRGTGGATNVSGSTYIYMAFAENPFTTSTGIPTTAR